jgi:hypothetical protein
MPRPILGPRGGNGVELERHIDRRHTCGAPSPVAMARRRLELSQASLPSVVFGARELGPLLGLAVYHRATGDPVALEAVRRAVEFFLEARRGAW